MKGLILKDLYIVVKEFKSFFLICAVFMGLSFFQRDNPFFLFYPVLLFGMIPGNLVSFDETSKWNIFCAASPCSPRMVVTGKYLMGLLLQALPSVMILGVQMVTMLMGNTFSIIVLGQHLAIIFTFACLLPALSLPLIFKMGANKGRIAQLVMIGIFTAVSVGIPNAVPALMNAQAPVWVLPVIALGVYTLSWQLSVRFYQKREIG